MCIPGTFDGCIFNYINVDNCPEKNPYKKKLKKIFEFFLGGRFNRDYDLQHLL